MKKTFFMILIMVLVFAVAFPQTGMCRDKVNMHAMLKDAKEVAVYVEDITDATGSSDHVLEGIKKHLENALDTRMSVNFEVVEDIDDADLVISCEVTEYIWLEEDPVDQITGATGVAYDVLMKENYARLQATFSVRKGPKKVVLFKRRGGLFRRRNILYKNNLQVTITRKTMSMDESVPLVEEGIIKVFMRRCFSKNAKSLRR
ncbi:MAG: hypothetical protein P9L88_05780 [Candidatus Tantalella remota]|nr:hypothetical protein [Candidatus Tantalella remota]